MASRDDLAAELRLEFESTRRELDEMADEIASAEARLAELARHDLQVVELRAELALTRAGLERLNERERALKATFNAAIGDRPNRTH